MKIFYHLCFSLFFVTITSGIALAAGEGGSLPLVSIGLNSTLLIQLANFLFLIVALNFLLYRPIRKILAERKELFTRLKNKAAKAKAELESGEAEKARLNAESLRQGLNLKNELVLTGQQQEISILAEALEQAARKLSENRELLAQSVLVAETALVQETQLISKEIAEKILGRAL